MLARTWKTLFQHIPPEQHPRFTLVTMNGTEISLQLILRLEAEFAIVKGRLSGSQDAGRVFFIPYASIDTFSFTNPVRESDVADMFDSLRFDGSESRHEPPAAPPVTPPALPPSTQGTALRPVDPPSGQKPAIRSEVLERFRSSRPASSFSLPRPVEGTS